MQTYTAAFESEYGMEFATIQASNLREATKILKAQFADDIGADGFWTDDNGDETPINW